MAKGKIMAGNIRDVGSQMSAGDRGNAVETIIEDFEQPDMARPDPEGTAMKPCSIGALGSAASGGFIGALYGAGSKLVMHRGAGRLKAARVEALSSAKAFAVFGGVYAFAQCVIQRLRQKEDIYTSGLAGCATGLVMGIGNGFQGALASAAMMGGFSVVIDLMGKPEAQAASLLPRQEGQKIRIKRQKRRPRHPRLLNGHECILCPALPLPLRIAESLARQTHNSFKKQLLNS